VVRIETERLILRPLTVDDLEDVVELHAQPTVVEFLGPTTRDLARERLELCQRTWQERGHDLIALIERSGGRFVGRTGLKYWPQFNETEVGWVLHRAAWGHGYATEAARAVIDWGFRTFPLPYITAMIRPDNGRSLAVARRLGLTPIRDDSVFEIPVIVHATTREQWGAEQRPDEGERLLDHACRWACAREDVVAVGARQVTVTEVELLLLSPSAEAFPDAEQWAGELGAVVLGTGRRGALSEHRLATASGLELRVTIGSESDGAGWRARYDPEGILGRLRDARA
jgi:RimJ/RimL family protein N-acetyltransferase